MQSYIGKIKSNLIIASIVMFFFLFFSGRHAVRSKLVEVQLIYFLSFSSHNLSSISVIIVTDDIIVVHLVAWI